MSATTRSRFSFPFDHHLDRDHTEAEIEAGAAYTEAEIEAGVLDAVIRILGADVANWPTRPDPIDATCEDFYRAAGGVM